MAGGQRRRRGGAQPQAPAIAAEAECVGSAPAEGSDPALTAPAKPRSRRSKGASAAPNAALAAEASPPSPAQATPVQRCTASAGVLLIADGNYLANRSYFGYGGRGLSTSGGVPTSVTYGVIRVLQAAIRSVRPTALAVVFDPPGPTFRSVMSLLDPEAAAAGPAAAALVRQGRLDWQDLADRLLGVERLQADMRAAAAADATATPASYLHPSGSFLHPLTPPSAHAAAAGGGDASQQHMYPSASVAAPRAHPGVDLMEVLVAALGPDLAAALGFTGDAALAAAARDRASADILVPPYKAGRLSKGDDFYTDLGNLQRLLGLMSVPPLSRPWLEADDLAGLLVQQAVQCGMAVRIVSGDRDLMQLVNDTQDVSLLYPAAASRVVEAGAAAAGRQRGAGGGSSGSFPFTELQEADVVSALGVTPGLVADYKALVGDGSDRLPGVSGIGPKTAAQLLASYGSLAGVYGSAGAMTPKRRASLQDGLPASQYTLALARVLGSPGAPTLPPGVLPADLLSRLHLRGFDCGLVGRALEELEMRSLAKAAAPGGEIWAAFRGGVSMEASVQ